MSDIMRVKITAVNFAGKLVDDTSFLVDGNDEINEKMDEMTSFLLDCYELMEDGEYED